MIISDKNFKSLNKYIPQLLKANLYKNKKFECCPHCGSIHFIKHGRYNGIQRYKCIDCRKTFSDTTNSLWYYSKKQADLWIKFTELFLQRKTLRECAKHLKINLATSFYWRHKIMNVLKSTNMDGINPENLKGDVFITSLYFQEGRYSNILNFKMDFYFKQKRIFVAVARGNEDSLLMLPFGRNYFRTDEFEGKVNKRIDKDSYIVTMTANRNKLLNNVVEIHNRKVRKAHRKSNKIHKENKIINIERKIEKWFKNFHGISSKYLEDYIAYFILYNLDKCFRSLEMSYSLLKKFGFIRTDKIKKIKLCI